MERVTLQPGEGVLVRAVKPEPKPPIPGDTRKETLSGLRGFMSANWDFIYNLQSGKAEDRDEVPKGTIELIKKLRAAGLNTKEVIIEQFSEVSRRGRRKVSPEEFQDLVGNFYRFVTEVGEGIPK